MRLEHRYETIRKNEDVFAEARKGEIVLSSDQEVVYEGIQAWLRKPMNQVFAVGGYAGTGKSTLLSKLISDRGDLCFAGMAYTGKATNVLRQKLAGAAETSTMHRFLYTPGKGGGEFTRKTYDELEYKPDVLAIDEGSMVNDDMLGDATDLGIPTLVVGDHFQLPPVQGVSSVMKNPDERLEVIHRQAEGSPIIQLSVHIRNKGGLPMPPPKGIRFLSWPKFLAEAIEIARTTDFLDTVVLTYKNKTRNEVNAAIRAARFGSGSAPLQVGEPVVCLKNARGGSIFNGMRGIVEKVDVLAEEPNDILTVLFEEDRMRHIGPVLRVQFGLEKTIATAAEAREAGEKRVKGKDDLGMLYDYGYALTVHKSQGSSFKRVYLVKEKPRRSDDGEDMYARWLYTGVTRSSEELTIVVR